MRIGTNCQPLIQANTVRISHIAWEGGFGIREGFSAFELASESEMMV